MQPDNENEASELYLTGANLPIPTSAPPFVQELLLACWQLQAEDRPSFEDLYDELSHNLAEAVRKKPLKRDIGASIRQLQVFYCFDL